jgi:hypothetical protein
MSESKRASGEFGRSPPRTATRPELPAVTGRALDVDIEDSGPRPLLEMTQALALLEEGGAASDPYNAVGRLAARSRSSNARLRSSPQR